MKSLARLVSILFNPLFFGAGMIIIIASRLQTYNGIVMWAVVTMVFFLLFVILVLLLVHKKIFNNMDVSKRKNRFILYPLALSLTMIYLLTVVSFKGPSVFAYGALVLSLALIILDVVNYKVKASVHVGMISAIVIVMLFEYGLISLSLFLIVALVAWSRMKLHRHTLLEVCVGAALGIILATLGMIGVQYLL